MTDIDYCYLLMVFVVFGIDIPLMVIFFIDVTDKSWR